MQCLYTPADCDTVLYRMRLLQSTGLFYDYLIFGHRHKVMDVLINEKSRYINLGEWVLTRSYAVFDGEDVLFCH